MNWWYHWMIQSGYVYDETTGNWVYMGTTDDAEIGMSSRGVVLSNEMVTDAETEAEADEESTEDTDAQGLDDIEGLGQSGTLCTILLSPGSAWALVGTYGTDDAYYEQSFSHAILTESTVLIPLALTRSALPADITWISDDGSLSFRCRAMPENPITISGLLIDTGDPWQAKGVLEARPGANWAAVTYKQSLHVSGWSLSIPAGQSATVQTPVSFTTARFLFGTPQGVTGADGVLVTRMYVSAAGYFCYTLYNASAATATLTDADIRILYSGTLSGFVSSNQDDETVRQYIAYEDYAEI